MKRILVITCALLSGAIAHAQSFTGKVDTSFGGSGYFYYVHNAGSTDLTATKLLAQEDGGILMIAAPRVNYANPGFIGKTSYVYRLQPDGTKDPNFGDPSTPGIQRIGGNRSGVTDDVRLYTGAITSDKKILVAGYHNNASGGINNTYNLIVMRLHSDGKVDSSFGTNGFVSHNLKPFTLQLNHDFYAMVLQKDGKIILAGEREAGFPTSAAMVCRLHPDGRIDSSFNGIGFQSELYMERRGTIRTSVALQSDERIVVCGSHERQFGADESLSLTRLTTGGIVASSFGTYGRFNAHYLLNSQEFPVNGYDIQVLPDDRIVAGGIMQFYQANYHRYASGLVRILKDSDEDTSFKPHLSDPTNHGLQWYHSNVNTAQDEAPDESIYRILIDDDSSMLLVGASRDQLDYGMIARLDY